MKRQLSLILAVSLSVLLLASCGRQQQDNRSTLQLKTTPEGAVVTVFGKELCTTPWTSKVPPGTYVFRFDKPNYKSYWEKVVVPPNTSKTIEIQLKPVCASIMITSVPTGIKVQFEGTEIGETPVTLKDVPAGAHSAILKRPGYVQKSIEWTVEDSRPQLFKVEMSSNVGTLRIDSKPSGANLSIDGEPRGITPFNERIEQGQHKIRMEKEGFAIFEQLATVNRDKTTNVAANLQVLPGSLKVSSNPSGATVFIGDRQYGSTPTEIKDLQPGQYKVSLERAGHDRVTSDVSIRPGQRLEIDLTMDSNTGGIDLVANPPGVTVYVDGRMVGTTEVDPAQAGFSKIFSIRNLGAGSHTVMVAHKRAVPDKRSFEVTVKKGKIERMPVISLWIANATLKLRGGPTYTGRLISETDSEVLFEPEPGIRQTYKKDEIVMLKRLKEQE